MRCPDDPEKMIRANVARTALIIAVCQSLAGVLLSDNDAAFSAAHAEYHPLPDYPRNLVN